MDETKDCVGLRSRIADLSSWLFEQSLPLWSTAGLDGDLGFAEHLSLTNGTPYVDRKRLRVQARQVYVFSHASALGFKAGEAAADSGWRFMRMYELPGGGWARLTNRSGEVLDSTFDLYDQAFGLLACAWRYRASNDPEALSVARRAVEEIDRRLTSSTESGWLSEDGPAAERLQNPIMHLFESLLALESVTGDHSYSQRVTEIVRFFESTLFDPTSGTLAEYFGPNWARASGLRGRIIEPGHQYEWVWLLHQTDRTADRASAESAALFEFARKADSALLPGSIADEVLDDGSLFSGGTRTWPITEALKAHVVRAESLGTVDPAPVCDLIDDLRNRFLVSAVNGGWTDHFDSDGLPDVDKIPASTLYHVFLAIAELLRLTELINQGKVQCP